MAKRAPDHCYHKVEADDLYRMLLCAVAEIWAECKHIPACQWPCAQSKDHENVLPGLQQKKWSGLHRALTSTVLNIFEMNAYCMQGLLDQHQCPKSLMSLKMNGQIPQPCLNLKLGVLVKCAQIIICNVCVGGTMCLVAVSKTGTCSQVPPYAELCTFRDVAVGRISFYFLYGCMRMHGLTDSFQNQKHAASWKGWQMSIAAQSMLEFYC